MPKRSTISPPMLEQKQWRTLEEIESALVKIQNRIAELEKYDVEADMLESKGMVKVIENNVRAMILDVFEQSSMEFKQFGTIQLWAGGMRVGMTTSDIINGRTKGKNQLIGVLNGLMQSLVEKKQELEKSRTPLLPILLNSLNLHPKIAIAAFDLFQNGHHWEAVFAASKTLVLYVKECSIENNLDGAPLMRTVFSPRKPVLAFNNLADQTELDEQEGMMHLFEGMVLGIRNPGGHSFPTGSPQRAAEYLSLINLLACRVQEAKKV